jgi:hypothetical protein
MGRKDGVKTIALAQGLAGFVLSESLKPAHLPGDADRSYEEE